MKIPRDKSSTAPVDFQQVAVEGRQMEELVGLITRHQVSLLAFLHAVVPNATDAEDLLQRVNLVLWRKREQFEAGTNFKAWAFSVARWEARAFFKERKRQDWLVFNDELTDLVAGRLASLPDVGVQSQPEALQHCLGRLSAPHRRLILDRYQSDRSIKDCAESVGRSEQGLRVTLHRIRIALRSCMDRYLQNHPA